MNQRRFVWKGIDYKIDEMTGLLDLMEVCPRVLVGKKSLERVAAFITGVRFGLQWNGNGTFDSNFELEDFEKWVHERHNHERLSLNSFSLATKVAGEGDFERWFDWLREYRQSA